MRFMSAGKFKVSYSATAQLARLPSAERAQLNKLFSSDLENQPENTRVISNGHFVSKIGAKRVLWRRMPQQKPEILSIVDKSFARG